MAIGGLIALRAHCLVPICLLLFAHLAEYAEHDIPMEDLARAVGYTPPDGRSTGSLRPAVEEPLSRRARMRNGHSRRGRTSTETPWSTGCLTSARNSSNRSSQPARHSERPAQLRAGLSLHLLGGFRQLRPPTTTTPQSFERARRGRYPTARVPHPPSRRHRPREARARHG